MPARNDGVTTRTLDRALALLDQFGPDAPSLGLTELARRTGLSKATVYRLLATLERRGFVRRAQDHPGDRRYALGLRLLELGALAAESLELRRVARPAMARLRDELEVSVQLVVREGNEAVYIDKLDSPRPVRLYIRVGRRAPLYAGACPRTLLAWWTPAERDAYLRSVRPRAHTPSTITSPEALLQGVEATLRDGYTVSWGELEPNTVGVAVPLVSHAGGVVAALSIAGPAADFPEAAIPEVARTVQRTGEEISRTLGYQGPYPPQP